MAAGTAKVGAVIPVAKVGTAARAQVAIRHRPVRTGNSRRAARRSPAHRLRMAHTPGLEQGATEKMVMIGRFRKDG